MKSVTFKMHGPPTAAKGPHMAIPAVHIAPPGTGVGMPRVVAGLYGGVGSGVGLK